MAPFLTATDKPNEVCWLLSITVGVESVLRASLMRVEMRARCSH
jgi:hypothetical protein